MHWTRVSLFCLGAALLASSQPAFAQVVNEQTGVVQLEDFSGSMSLSNDGGSWMQVDRMSGDGVGFQSGYTRIGIRTKLADFGESHLFTELNGTMNDHARLGTNLNVGYRTMYDGGVLGVHGGYDHYESNYGKNYQQAVVGAEYLHQWLDFRANGYMPFGDRDNFIGVIDPGSELTFFGHDFGTIGVAQVERSLAGFDAEVGAPLPVATFLKLFGGTYYLTANDNDTWGVRSRLEARVGESSTVSLMVSDDDRFGTNLNLNATIWYGGGPSSPFKFQRDRSGASRRYDPVRRAQTVQLAQDHEAINVPLTNAETDARFNITWVDNTATAPGDGTFENPFTELPDNAPGSDYILVRRGVGNTVGNIVLENDQHMFGEGRTYTVDTVELGTVTIPDQFFDQTGARPELVATNGALPLVTLANNNEVINFNMTGGGVGIFGNVVNDFRIEHVAIDADNGVFISDASGTGLLNNIDVVADGTGTGVFIRAVDAGPLDLTMTDITSTGGSFGVQILADGSTVNATIDGLVTDDTSDTAVVLEQFDGLLNVDLENVDIGANSNDGILISSVLGQTNVNMNDVTVRGAGTLLNVLGTSTEITLNATDVDFSNSAGGTGVMIDVDDTIGTFNFTNLIASNNNDDGFRLNAENLSVVDANIIDSDVSFNGDNNFDVTTSGGSVVNFFVDPTTATDSGNEAFSFVATDAGTILNSTFIDVDLARAGGSAIVGTVQDGAVSTLNLTNVQASDSGQHGLDVSVFDSATFTANIQNSTFTRSGIGNNGIGVNLFVQNNSDAVLNMDETPANNNGSLGFQYQVLTGADGASSLIANVTQGNFSDNPDNNVIGQVTGVGSTAVLNFTDVTADLLGANGSVQLASLAGGRTDVVWTGINSSISQSDADGVNLTADGAGSIMNFAFSDGRINTNGGQGIDALASNSGSIQIDLTDAEVILNTNENVLGTAVTGGSVIVNATNSNLSDGGLTTNLDNVLLSSNGAGSIVGGVFDTVTLDNSGLNGLHAVASNLGSMDLEFLTSDTDPLTAPGSASNNLNGSGIRIEGNNADIINVASSGDSIISDNLNDNVDVDIAGANSATVQIAGLMDRSLTGDGINVSYDNVLAGGIDIGPGSAIDNFDDGVDILVANSNLDTGISVSGMTATGNGDEPIIVTTTNSTITGGVIGGNTTDGGNNGISWFSDSGTVDINIANNSVTNATDNGILVDLSGTVVGNEVHIDFNSVTGDGLVPQTGIQLSLSNNASLLNGTINSNSASNAAGNGILVSAVDNALVDTLEVSTNILSGNGGDGFQYNASGNTTLNSLVVADNAADLNVGNGLNVQLDNVNGNGTVEFRGNLSSSNGGNGILLTGVDTSLTSVDVLANETNSNGGDGISIDLTAPSGLATLGGVTVENNTATANAGAGINIFIDGFDTAVIVPDVTLASNVTTDNGAEGVALEISNMDAGALTIADSTLDTNGADGLRVSLTNNATGSLSIVRNTAINNVLNGFNYDADNAALGNLEISDNQGIVLPGASVLATIGGVHWEITNTTADPTVLIDTVQYDVGPTGLTFATTRGAGFDYQLFFNAVATGLQTVNGLPVNTAVVNQPGVVADGSTVMDMAFNDFDNTDNPLHFDLTVGDAAAAAVQNTADIAGTIFTANFSNGASLSGSFDATGVLSLVQAATGTGVSGNGLAGILIGLDNGSSIGTMTIDGNDVIDNGTNGIQFNIAGGSTLPAAGSGVISNNTITGQTNGDGVNIVNPDTGATDFGISFQGNDITDNSGQGVNIALDGGVGVMTAEFIANNISTNGENGVLLSTTDTASLVVSDFSGNTVGTNGGMGVRIDATGTSSTEFNAGVTAAANGVNVIDGNVDAGIGAVLAEFSTGQFNIAGTTVTNTTDNAATVDFRGDGVHIRAVDNSTLLASTVGDAVLLNTTMDNNAGSGVSVFLDGLTTTAGAFTVQNSTLTNNGTNDITNLFDGDAGFRFVRQGQSTSGGITVDNNIMTGNTNGMIALARQANQFDIYTITNNTIDSNDSNGILLQGEADASIAALIQDNSISNNGNEGLRTTRVANSPADATEVQMDVFGNTISNNGQNGNAARGQGIRMDAGSGSLIIGGPAALGNVISNNLGEGIQINNSVNMLVENNLIQSNGGVAGIDLNANAAPIGIAASIIDNQILDNAGDGIEISSLISGVGATQLLVNVTNNDILRNGEDGVEIINNSNGFINDVTVDGNTIEDNLGRGVAIFNRGNGANVTTNLTVDVSDNSIQRNGQEAIYVVNTASAVQDTDALSNVALDDTGNIEAAPRLTLNVDNNTVQNNGILSSFGGTGLVIRVGTSDALTLGTNGETAFTDDGGTFASGRGGIGATVTDNTFGGNFGADVLIESFVSTPTPLAQTTGTWTDQNEAVRNNANDLFDVDSFVQDPLARIDLTFTGNTGDETDVSRSGAFFNNDESVFKSRTQAQDNATDGGVDDNGPFTSGTRRRNAQSLASRTPPFDDPLLTIAGTGGTANNSDAFLYSGTWNETLGLNTGSTFRVSAGSDLFTAGFTSGDTFGTLISNGVLFGEQAFGWSTF